MDDVTRRKRSFAAGCLLSLAGKPLPISKREPVAYLYNGVRLPKLPESELPYAVVEEWESTFDGYTGKVFFLSFYSEKIEWKQEGEQWFMPGKVLTYSTTDSAKIAEYYDRISGPGAVGLNVWGTCTEEDGIAADNPIWTNTDFINADGSVYLAASEPIPVYE